MHKDRQILTLQQAKKEHEKDKQTNHPDRLHSTTGLIVDASGAYRYEKNRDFTQKPQNPKTPFTLKLKELIGISILIIK